MGLIFINYNSFSEYRCMLAFVAFGLGQCKRNFESPISGGCPHNQIAFASTVESA